MQKIVDFRKKNVKKTRSRQKKHDFGLGKIGLGLKITDTSFKKYDL